MLAKFRSIHLYAGWLFVLIFVLTGQYMRHVIHPAMVADPVLRYSIRANHIYILLFGLLHLCLGAYWRVSERWYQQRLQLAGSSFLLLATVVTIAAFFFEPKVGEARLGVLSAMVAAVVGVGLHLLSVRNTSHPPEE
ncbi:MAG: hypothetical protein HYR56_14620 [Acidobacteria bacterium]|nr:hypothetical protein [Acidobacteriota bacterium]MBI3425775.1 hypothetical protein [Acidobacteriota bacterium]